MNSIKADKMMKVTARVIAKLAAEKGSKSDNKHESEHTSYLNKKDTDISNMKKEDAKDMLDKRSFESDKYTNTTKLNYEEKIEKALRENPKLLKNAIKITELHSINKHLEDSLEKLDSLNDLAKENPSELIKINEVKTNLVNHIHETKNKVKKLNDLNKAHKEEKTLEQSNEKNVNKEHDSKEKVVDITLER